MKFFLISLGGILGANARFLLGSLVSERLKQSSFPWGTFIINVTGSLLLGLFMELSRLQKWDDSWRLLIAVGFLGAYTTFSTFEYESIRLILDGQWQIALRYLLGSVATGLLGVWLGVLLARLLGQAHR